MSDFFCGEFLLQQKAQEQLDDFCFAMQTKAAERKLFISFEGNALAQRIVYELVQRGERFPSSLCFLVTNSPLSNVSDDLFYPDRVVFGDEERRAMIMKVLEDFGSLLEWGLAEGFLLGCIAVISDSAGVGGDFTELTSHPGGFGAACWPHFEGRNDVPSLRVLVCAE